jgi:hypothetical protein
MANLTIGDTMLSALRAIAAAEARDPHLCRTPEEWAAFRQVADAIAAAEYAIRLGSAAFSTPNARPVREGTW